MEYPAGLSANDKLSWVIGVVARNETYLYMKTRELLAELNGQLGVMTESRDAHGYLLDECRRRINDFPEGEIRQGGRGTIKRAKKAVGRRNDLLHSVWTAHEEEGDDPTYSRWFSVFDEVPPPRQTFTNFGEVAVQLIHAAHSITGLIWMLHAARLSEINGSMPISDRWVKVNRRLMLGQFSMQPNGNFEFEPEAPSVRL